jgi:hypothetical protein
MIGRRSHDDASSFEAALHGATPRDEDIADLVRLAEDICEAAVAEPDPEFRSTLRTRLMTEARMVLVPAPTTSRRPPPRAAAPPRRLRGRSLVAATIAAAGVVGIVASSASAVPGELLYPVKRTVESVELQLHRGDASRGSFQLERATERLAEARTLSTDGASTDLIADTLDDFSSAAADGSSKLFTEFDATGQDAAIRTINDFATESSADLTELSSRLPEGAAASFDAARDTVTDLVTEASSLCDSCVPADVGALVNAVGDLAGRTPVPQPTESTKAPPDAGSAQQPTNDPAAPAAGSTPAPKPTTATPKAPVPAVPSRTPSLTDLTDPLVGGLLGDDTQPGLVPGLLNGLLGQTPPTR